MGRKIVASKGKNRKQGHNENQGGFNNKAKGNVKTHKIQKKNNKGFSKARK